MRIGGRLVILEGLVMCAVILLQCATQVCGRGGANRGRGCRRRGCGSKATLKPSPGHAFGVHEISNVGTCHRNLFGAAAIVVERIWIGDDRSRYALDRDLFSVQCLSSTRLFTATCAPFG